MINFKVGGRYRSRNGIIWTITEITDGAWTPISGISENGEICDWYPDGTYWGCICCEDPWDLVEEVTP